MKYLGWLNSFSGGIFMGIGLFLLLPSASEEIEHYFHHKKINSEWTHLPFGFIIAFLAYSFLLFMEKVAFNTMSIIPLQYETAEFNRQASEEKDSSADESSVHSHVHAGEEHDSDEDEETIRNVISNKGKFASFLQIRNCT